VHPKNRHKNTYDLKELCQKTPQLEAFITKKFGKETIDFSNPKAVKLLNQALLKTHYNLSFWDFSDSNLCPPIPGRADYIHHLQDLIDKQKNNIRILDIGTGATLIYPLLGNAIYNWQFVGSDIDEKSLKNAQKIIDKNNLSKNIQLLKQQDSSHILKGILTPEDHFDATMCNPPFYKSEKEAASQNSRKQKNLKLDNKKRNFSGVSNELWYAGGEKAFLHNYLYESTHFKENSTWFTTLVSKKENVKSMVDSLKKLGAKSIKIIPMELGNKKSRIVAWSFVVDSCLRRNDSFF